VAEGAPLLREYGVLSLIKGSNPFVSASLKSSKDVNLLSFFSWGMLPQFAHLLDDSKPHQLRRHAQRDHIRLFTCNARQANRAGDMRELLLGETAL
jgi:hypothetical protein